MPPGGVIQVVVIAMILACGSYALARWRVAAGLVFQLVPMALSVMLFLEFADPAIAGAIRVDHGRRALLILRSLPMVVMGLSVAGLVLAVRQRRGGPNSQMPS